jgi:thiopurine S-methyltransferase
MEASFWLGKWERNEINFHEHEGSPLLVRHFKSLSLPEGGRVFVPLCGKTRDIHWLLSAGHRVAGAELSKLAVEQLFVDLGVKPTITPAGKLTRYSADGIDIFLGDIFELSGGELGRVDAIYDRAALVAFPEVVRDRYAAHLMTITERAPQLLLCFEYDQRLLAGPPFSVSADEVARHYQNDYGLELLAQAEIKGGLKGCAAKDSVWLLKRRG